MFIKYPNLVNFHNIEAAYLDKSQIVTVTEKIDGSNFSVIVDGDVVRFASRNQLIGGDWHNAGDLLDQELLDILIRYSKINGVTINFFGEIFSSKILRRIPYGNTRICFYDVMINGELKTGFEFECFITTLFKDNEQLKKKYIVPFSVMNLKEALAIDVESYPSMWAKGHMSEGIVIKGYHKFLRNKCADILIKKKASKFLERKNNISKNTRKTINLTQHQLSLLDYVNESRVLSAESKLGEYTIEKTGEFLREISQDAIADFLKDHAELKLTKKDYMSAAFMLKIKEVLFKMY